MALFDLFVKFYAFLFKIRLLCLSFCAVLLIAALFFLSRQQLREDISLFLPDYNQSLVKRYEAFQYSPVARLVFLTLELKGSSAELAKLSPAEQENIFIEAANFLYASLPPELFSKIYPEQTMPSPEALLSLMPNLLEPQDFAWLESKAQPENISKYLQDLKAKLASPEGIVLKHFVNADPLGFLALLPQKISQTGFAGSKSEGDKGKSSLANFSAAGFGSGLPSKDGRARMFIAEAKGQLTDGQLAFAIDNAVLAAQAQLQDLFKNKLNNQLNNQLNAEGLELKLTALSPHAHTVANIKSIKADTSLVLGASITCLFLLFCVYLRKIVALPVLFLPCIALTFAVAIMLLSGVHLSGISLGFGAVLLGIVTDYGLYVYCAFDAERSANISLQQKHKQNNGAALPPLGSLVQSLSPSMFFAFATTAGIFMVLLSSGLPGIRQVAVFSLLGLSVGFVLALFVFPLLLSYFCKKPTQTSGQTLGQTLGQTSSQTLGQTSSQPAESPPHNLTVSLPQSKKITLRPVPCFIFVCALVLSFSFAKNISINGELRALGVQDQDIVKAEESVKNNWGQSTRSFAMLAAEGASLEQSLEKLAAVIDKLPAHLASESKSILTFIPALKKQEQGQALWAEFKAKHHDFITQLEQSAIEQGYSASAFKKFKDFYAQTPSFISPQSLDASGLSLINALFLPSKKDDPKQYALALLPDLPELAGLELMQNLPEGVLLISPLQIASEINTSVSADFVRLSCIALIVVLAFLTILFRKAVDIFIASVPMLTALGFMVLVLGLWGRPLNLFAVAVLPLVLGLCADYGIFMLHILKKQLDKATKRAIFLAGCTTLSGFACLLLAEHPALFSLGLTVSLGLSVGIPAALWLVPFLVKKEQ